MSLFILPAESQGAGAQPWMAGGAGTDDKHVLRGGKELILPYTLLPQHLGTAGMAYAKQKKKRKRIPGHLSSQWLHTPVHPSGQMLLSTPISLGLPLIREGVVQW